jgi:adenine-specific DNA-methyltransferase
MDLETPFLTKNLITYLGNKRKLLGFIQSAVDNIRAQLGNREVSILDGFSGTGCVSRILKYTASTLYVNDLEPYSEVTNLCYLANRSEINEGEIRDTIDRMNSIRFRKAEPGFVATNYAPTDDANIQLGERAFYTAANARIIDNIRHNMFSLDPSLFPFVAAPLLVKASIHANTGGVFKGFYKNKAGVGQFGGQSEQALSRIKAEIVLDYPVFSDRECPVHVYRNDINQLIKGIPEVDIAYYDPPYNQHPYGSNYFMLNLIMSRDNPEIQDGVAGIAKEWNRSLYNKRRMAEGAMNELIANTAAKYIVVSYNNEGIIPPENFALLMRKHGDLEVKTNPYATYRASRNLFNRSKEVTEILWILKKR